MLIEKSSQTRILVYKKLSVAPNMLNNFFVVMPLQLALCF